jgi:hypothetical protein
MRVCQIDDKVDLGYCLAFVGEGGENGCPGAVGMVAVVDTDPGELLVDGWEVEHNNGKRNQGGD